MSVKAKTPLCLHEMTKKMRDELEVETETIICSCEIDFWNMDVGKDSLPTYIYVLGNLDCVSQIK